MSTIPFGRSPQIPRKCLGDLVEVHKRSYGLLVVNDAGDVHIRHTETNETLFPPVEVVEAQASDTENSEIKGKCTWSDDQTKCLLNLIAGIPFIKAKFKTKRERWHLIAEELRKLDMGKFTADQCRNRYNTLISGMKRVKDNTRRTSQNRAKLQASGTVQKMLEELVGRRNCVVFPNVLHSDNNNTVTTIHTELSNETVEDQSLSPPKDSETPTDSSRSSHTRTTSFRSKSALVMELRLMREQQKEIAEQKDRRLQKLIELLEEHNAILRAYIQKQ